MKLTILGNQRRLEPPTHPRTNRIRLLRRRALCLCFWVLRVCQKRLTTYFKVATTHPAVVRDWNTLMEAPVPDGHARMLFWRTHVSFVGPKEVFHL